MNLLFPPGRAMPFPAFASSIAEPLSAVGVGLRPFGIFESDLAVDFKDTGTPALITRILEQCAVDPDGILPEGFFRDLSAGKRLEFLLVLATDGVPELSFPFHCSGCGQELEFELTIEEIAAYQETADAVEIIEVELAQKTLVLRKPSGRDQENWSNKVFPDERYAAEEMIRSLAVGTAGWEPLEDDELVIIDDAMDEADPLVNFLGRAECSDCGHSSELSIDLCGTALGMLARLQQRLIVSIHKLASHYHWSEKEIFDIPHWRRSRYLDLIAAQRR